MSKRKVTERDFRLTEFKNANPDDYEFRDSDNKLVRKDRFKMGMSNISGILGSYDYEIDALIRMITVLVDQYPDRERCDNCGEYIGICTCKNNDD